MKNSLRNQTHTLAKLQNENHVKLKDIVDNGKLSTRLVTEKFKLGNKPEKSVSGLYAFWWTGDLKTLPDGVKVTLTTPNKKQQTVKWDKKDVLVLEKGKFPLYIGKSTNVVKRISQHLSLGTHNWRNHDKFKKGKVFKKTTACQFRAGIEHLFNYQKNLNEILDNVSVSFVPVPNGKNGEGIKERFYLEALAIGLFQPWFNVDSER